MRIFDVIVLFTKGANIMSEVIIHPQYKVIGRKITGRVILRNSIQPIPETIFLVNTKGISEKVIWIKGNNDRIEIPIKIE
jgi:hypothetical protein